MTFFEEISSVEKQIARCVVVNSQISRCICDARNDVFPRYTGVKWFYFLVWCTNMKQQKEQLIVAIFFDGYTSVAEI